MTTPSSNEGFFQVGGALEPGAPSYVTRQADVELMQAVLSSQYCNVLTARQMGKSSLMSRTVSSLRDEGIRTVVIDLSGLGTQVSASEWYFGLISRFKRQLDLTVDEVTWWREREQLGAVQRFSDFLRQVVLEEVQESIVVFVDELDSTLKLPFTDDFFAAIRAAYNARASDPVYNRLTFVLLGVARPSDLIKERTRTPYNIGTSIDLRDFTAQEAQVLLTGLEASSPEEAKGILKQVLYWTSGHPYLTQKVCSEVGTKDDYWADGEIDKLVQRLFFTEEARKETNLQFIRDRFRMSRERDAMLRTYRQVWSGKRVDDEERSPVKSQLKLTGLVKATPDGMLKVRNPIYAQVFDKEWVKENIPVSRAQWITIAATMVAFLALLVVGFLLLREPARTGAVEAEVYRSEFLNATSPEVRISSLAGLFDLGGRQAEGRDLFFDLEMDQQLVMFEGLANPQDVGQQVLVVVWGVYRDPRLINNPNHNRLLEAMAEILHLAEGAGVSGAAVTAAEIDFWAAGRNLALQGKNALAVEEYKSVTGLNESNPSVFYDRAVAYVEMKYYEAALADFDRVIELDRELNLGWSPKIQEAIVGNSALFTYQGTHRDDYPNLFFLPTLTPTPTPTSTSTPTFTPTPTLLPTPELIRPEEGAEYLTTDEITLAWDWFQVLEEDQRFVVLIQDIGETTVLSHTVEPGEELIYSFGPTDEGMSPSFFAWLVRVEQQVAGEWNVVAESAARILFVLFAPTDTPVPPTDTPTQIPSGPTDTPVPPTDTPVPPTDTPVPPTDTPVPPTPTRP